MTAAAIYLRSSKDRHDLSMDAQRRTLHEHAALAALAVVAEYADAVESGKDEDRPGFQRLLAALKRKDREWSVLLALDTSRIARRRHLALIFEHEAERAGVRIQYANVPDTDPITGMLLRSILQAMDEWHSLTSKAKGLAGMAESVRQGWRAGGRAPRGYRLEHTPTGTLRDGQPVMRSKLVPTDDATAVAVYLRTRAQGKPRGIASAASGIVRSLNELEWQALTYAGHTVWGVHAEHAAGGYKGGHKRKPRAEWQITRDTHPALISDDEAESILQQLEDGQTRRNRAGNRVYLLSGLLISPDGQPYSGETTKGAGFYRLGKGRRISTRLLDDAVMDCVFNDLSQPDTAKLIADQMRAASAPKGKPRDITAMKLRLQGLDQKISRLVDLIAEDAEAAPAYRRAIGKMETDRVMIEAEIEAAAVESKTAECVALWTPEDVLRLLGQLKADLLGSMESGDVASVRTALSDLVDVIEYDADQRLAEIRYRLDTGVKMASPRGGDVAPVEWSSKTAVRR